jgi:glyoxylase-like metal-dependent hydrolase (beta-lactamase superfamily II)
MFSPVGDLRSITVDDQWTLSIGDLDVWPVFDGLAREDPTALYRVRHGEATAKGFTADDWLPHRDLLNADGKIEHAYGGFLVRSGERLVLIDAGVGPGQIGPYGPAQRVIRGGALLYSLALLGVALADITDVVLTHLHPDHYGWATAEGGDLFPNAVIRCHALDWDHFVTDPPSTSSFTEALKPLGARLEVFDHDGPIVPGVDAQLAPGHTPGSTIIVLNSGAQRALLLGDAVHCPVELVDVEWASLGDFDPAVARRTREQLARELEGSATPAAGAHFTGMRFGRLIGGNDRRRWVVP